MCLSLWAAFTVGCVSAPFPQSSLTGQVVKVSIGEAVNPHAVTAKPGDEISWVNTTAFTVDVWFVPSIDGVVSCNRGFVSSGWGYMFAESVPDNLIVATIHPGGTASLCFGAGGMYPYRVHVKDASTGPRTKMTGSIVIQ